MDLFADLNEPQREAVKHVDGPLLVLAGAGSGKTRVITRRVAHLIEQGIPPWQVLAITFTNKAAGEMRERVDALGTPRGATVSTFHALCARLLREFAEPAGLQQNFTIYDHNDQLKLVKEAMAKLDLPTDRMPPAKVHAAISNAKNDLQTSDAYARQAGDFFGKKVVEVYRQYEKLLAANNALDFDDLLLRVVYLMRDRQDIRELLGRRYQYILIDEYQDTNHAQYLLAHGMAMEHENLCATGDPDQSIYAWRGADISNIMEFEQDYPSAKVVRLEENYRSSAPILASASRLIARNTQRKEKTLWTKREGGLKVRLLQCPDEHTEAREVAKRIAAYHAGGGQWGDVAVFYRVNALSRVLEKALREQVIPYAIARGVEFYNRKEIKDVLGYLRVMANPADDLSCARIINVPARGIGATTVGKLEAWAAAHNANLLEACAMSDEAGLSGTTAKKVQAFADMIRSMGAAPGQAVRDIVEEVIRRSGMEKSLGGDDEDNRQARSNLAELVTTAAEFDQEFGGSLAQYLQQVSLVSDVDRLEGSGGTVTLMTLHAAKGLEFPRGVHGRVRAGPAALRANRGERQRMVRGGRAGRGAGGGAAALLRRNDAGHEPTDDVLRPPANAARPDDLADALAIPRRNRRGRHRDRGLDRDCRARDLDLATSRDDAHQRRLWRPAPGRVLLRRLRARTDRGDARLGPRFRQAAFRRRRPGRPTSPAAGVRTLPNRLAGAAPDVRQRQGRLDRPPALAANPSDRGVRHVRRKEARARAGEARNHLTQRNGIHQEHQEDRKNM